MVHSEQLCSRDLSNELTKKIKKGITMHEFDKKNNFSYYIRGGIASMVAITITYPLNKLSMRQAMDGFSIYKAFNTIKKEGIYNLYRGLGPPLIQKSVTCAIMFGTYFSMKHYLFTSRFKNLSDQQIILISGMVSASLESFLTPFERIQTLLTCRTFSRYFTNTRIVASHIAKSSYPFKEFYRGYSAVLLRNMFSTTLFFSAKECFIRKECKYNLSHVTNVSFKNFIEGALLGTICSTVSYPINVTRFNMQRRFNSPFISFNKSLWEVMEARNYSFKKFYSGAGINIIRSFISWGIVNSTYELLKCFI